MNDELSAAAFEQDMKTPTLGSENQQVRARWKQGYRTGRRSACNEIAQMIQFDQKLQSDIAQAAEPFQFLAQYIREFSKESK
jgi:hypothetical protein